MLKDDQQPKQNRLEEGYKGESSSSRNSEDSQEKDQNVIHSRARSYSVGDTKRRGQELLESSESESSESMCSSLELDWGTPATISALPNKNV